MKFVVTTKASAAMAGGWQYLNVREGDCVVGLP